jgi:hypothetical protein
VQWFRFYTEFRSDPKVRTMPEALQLRLVILFCLKAEGGLEDLTDEMIGHAFRVSLTEGKRTRELFEGRGFINPGSWEPCNWSKRQRESDSSAGRMRNYRERKHQKPQQDTETAKKHVTDCDRHGDGNVTSGDTTCDALEQNRTEQIQSRKEQTQSVSDREEVKSLAQWIDQKTAGVWGYHADKFVGDDGWPASSWRAAWGIMLQMDSLPGKPWLYAQGIIRSWPGGIPPVAKPTTHTKGKAPPPTADEEAAADARLAERERQILAQMGRSA